MTCRVCGAVLERLDTIMPFKVAESRIVIIKGLPVLQYRNCSEYLIEDPVMKRVDAILASVDTTVELEILSYVA